MKRAGFTLTELIVVLMIMAIISSVALPLGSLIVKQSADKATREEIENLSAALIRYYKEHDSFPTTSNPLTGIRDYISTFGDDYLRDGWGEDYDCTCTYGSWGNDTCEIRSRGANKEWDACEDSGGDDICFSVEAPTMIRREKEEKVRNELAVVSLAAEAYAIREGDYPRSIDELYNGGYLTDFSFRTDLWGNDYYEHPSPIVNLFCSLGPNGIWDGGGNDDICP